MPLVYGQAVSFSPLLYRPRERWHDVQAMLTGDVVQPAAAALETDELLGQYAARINDAFWLAGERLKTSHLDALVVLVADTGRTFDDSNTPQLHVFAGTEIWGDRAYAQLGETPQVATFACAAQAGAQIAEELAREGFDVSETSGAYRPAGDPERGAVPALTEPLHKLEVTTPIVPIHVNAHVEPAIAGTRMIPFGAALGRVLSMLPQRFGVLASGGLSGQPGDVMAGWIDGVLDRWLMARLSLGRARDTAGIFEVQSQSLRGSTREMRLWTAAGAACEAAGLHAHADEYIPLHHAAAGIGFMHWR